MVDGEKVIREYADFKAMNPNHIPSKQEFMNIKQAMQQQQDQQKQLEQQETASKTAKNLGQAQIGPEKQDNMLSALN